MLRKITKSDYLQRYDNMDVAEKTAYLERVGLWLKDARPMLIAATSNYEARFQDTAASSLRWNDAQCAAFESGAILLSAVSHDTDTWLPDHLYTKAAKRCVERMIRILATVAGQDAGASEAGQSEAKPVEKKSNKQEQPKQSSAETASTEKTADRPAEKAGSAIPVRPKHIDQYVHLMPQKTQGRAAEVRGLLRDLDTARENAQRLMNANGNADDIARWARMATKIDERLKGIYDEIDKEWEKLVESGRVVVDEVGNVRLVPAQDGEETNDTQEPPSIDKHRRRELRKWLIDTRRGAEGKARETRIAKWKVNWEEYLQLEGDKAFDDEKIKAAAAHFGIELRKSEQEP